MTDFFTQHADKIVILSESGCWIWVGAATVRGYGRVFRGRRTAAGNKLPEGAHRVAYEVAHGVFDPSLHVLHRCDVPSCVNPDHLFLGDQRINMMDMAAKKRSCRGHRHGMTKLSDEDVMAIRRAYAHGSITYAEIGRAFDLNPSTIGAIVRGQSFKYLPTALTAGVAP